MPTFLLLLIFRNDNLFQLGRDYQHGTEPVICDNLLLRKTTNWKISQSPLITIYSSVPTQEGIKPQQEVVQEPLQLCKKSTFKSEFQNIVLALYEMPCFGGFCSCCFWFFIQFG